MMNLFIAEKSAEVINKECVYSLSFIIQHVFVTIFMVYLVVQENTGLNHTFTHMIMNFTVHPIFLEQCSK